MEAQGSGIFILEGTRKEPLSFASNQVRTSSSRRINLALKADCFLALLIGKHAAVRLKKLSSHSLVISASIGPESERIWTRKMGCNSLTKTQQDSAA